MNKFFETLELHKILEMLANETSNCKTREMALEIEPINDANWVKNEIHKVDEALELTVKYGTPTFVNFKDITGVVKRAQSGANLSLREILDIGNMLYQIRQLRNNFV